MATNRCPMCHLVNSGSAERCGRCGYQFGQPIETVRELLRTQLRRSRIAFWSMLIVLPAMFPAVGFIAEATGYVILPGILLIIGMVRTLIVSARQAGISRRSLASLDRQYPGLPKAVARQANE